jgi:hypothetical protein
MRSRHRTLVTVATALASVTILACGGEHSDPQYAKDGDTGAASPATQQTLSPNPQMGDSTQGLQGRTGTPMPAGDSGRPSLTTDSASKGTGVNPVPSQPQPQTKRP